jgi:hypothetical protein
MIGVKLGDPVDKNTLANAVKGNEVGGLRVPAQPTPSRPYALPSGASEVRLCS